MLRLPRFAIHHARRSQSSKLKPLRPVFPRSISTTPQQARFESESKTLLNVRNVSAVLALTSVGLAYTFKTAQADAQVTKVSKSPPPAEQLVETKSKLIIEPEHQELLNWSGTHSISTNRYFQPEDIEELKAIVHDAHVTRQKLRPVGSGLSPNGLPFSAGGMVNLVNMDSILNVDTNTNRVTVQAGARVSQVVEALRSYGLTLQNFASITEQQIGGFIQVGAHGTGVTIPPVDEQVVAIRLVTPAAGDLYLSADDEDPSLFHLVRTSLGLLGIVAEVTFQCVPAHKLIERTFVINRSEIESRHRELLTKNRHLRYMWIPHTNDVVVVTCNPAEIGDVEVESGYSIDERLEVARDLLLSHPKCRLDKKQVEELRFTALRDELLAIDPLDVHWLKKVNEAEASFWHKSQGTRIDWSDRILQFDCGGQQWVNEVAFPVPKDCKGSPDITYMQRLLDMIEEENVPAPAPLEQRWCAPSISPMSPASEKPGRELADYYSWVGIIMYLPDSEEDAHKRSKITKAFKSYKRLCEDKLWPDVHAVEHWAKIELPEGETELALLQQRIAQKYPVEAFKGICSLLDPHGILRSDLTNAIFNMPKP